MWNFWYTSYCLPLLLSNCSKIYFWKIFATKFSHKFWIMRLAWWGSTINLLIMANCHFWRCYKWQQWPAYSYLCWRAGYKDTYSHWWWTVSWLLDMRMCWYLCLVPCSFKKKFQKNPRRNKVFFKKTKICPTAWVKSKKHATSWERYVRNWKIMRKANWNKLVNKKKNCRKKLKRKMIYY